jgi:hypothetical protein
MLRQETRFGKPRDESAARLVKIPPFLVIHKLVQGTDTTFTSLRSGPQPHAIFDTLRIVGYGAMVVATWLKPHQDKFPALTLPKHYVLFRISGKNLYGIIQMMREVYLNRDAHLSLNHKEGGVMGSTW